MLYVSEEVPCVALAKHGPFSAKEKIQIVNFLTYMHYVYILRSIHSPDQTYIGSTSDIKTRILSHNAGANKHTSKFRPWKIIWICGFLNQNKAIAFEQYLKTASGIAFRKKRIL